MWDKQHNDISELISKTGSPYAAAMYSAKLARKHLIECKNSIPESQALSWAITGQEPCNLEEKIKQTLALLNPLSSTYLQDALSCIDDIRIRDCVANSYRLSVNSKKLRYDYKSIQNPWLQSRIRVITRLIYLNRFREE